jgi:hypothetical protein
MQNAEAARESTNRLDSVLNGNSHDRVNGLNRERGCYMALFGVVPRFLHKIDLPWDPANDTNKFDLSVGPKGKFKLRFLFWKGKVEKNVQ